MQVGFYNGDEHIHLSKLLDGGFARTIILSGRVAEPVQFDHNIMLDEGLYTKSVTNRYSTSTATDRTVVGVSGEFKYSPRDNECEKGVRYECSPVYSSNWERNKKSRFVHHTSMSYAGRRQTFQYAFSSAISAVKEIFRSPYITENYGVFLDESLQVRTLYEQFLPTDDLYKSLIDLKDDKFKLLELCIVSLFYLQKTFCLDRLEMVSYETNCASVIELFDSSSNILPTEMWEVYLVFLYMVSAGGEVVKLDSRGDWQLLPSSQKKFYCDIDYIPVSYQSLAIGEKPLNLRSNLMRIVEDINSILGYNIEILTTPYSQVQSTRELQLLRDLYILPNLIHTRSFNDCVGDLLDMLYSLDSLDKVKTLSASLKDYDVNGFSECLAKEVLEDLYKTYPEKFANYVRRCTNELAVPEISLSKQITSDRDYDYSYAPIHQGVGMLQYPSGNVDTQFVNIGYTLTEMQMDGSFLENPEILNTVTDLDTMYSLKNSPMAYYTKTITAPLLQQFRLRGNNMSAVSTYEVITEAVNNVILSAMGIIEDKMHATDAFINLLVDYANAQASMGTHQSVRNYYKALKLVNDLSANPKFLDIVLVESSKTLTLDLSANLYVLQQLVHFIPTILRSQGISQKNLNYILPESYYTGRNITAFINIIEAIRQIQGFFCKYTKLYPDVYTSPNEWLEYQRQATGEEEYHPSLWYNMEDTPIFSFDSLRQNVGTVAEKDISFLNVYNDLLKYVGNKGIFTIKDFSVTAHIERKIVYEGSTEDVSVQCIDLWEPHKVHLKLTIPYPECLRLKRRGFNTCTAVLSDNIRKVICW